MRGLAHGVCALALVACFAGCGGATTGTPDDDTVADTAIQPDTDATGTALTDTSGDAAPDVVEGEFTFGTNEVGANDPSAFSPVPEGGAIEVQFGFQGLWMVVIAFRTRDVFVGDKVNLVATLTAEGAEQGRLELTDRPLVVGQDGYRYLYNFFLVVDDPGVAGSVGTIALRVWDPSGHEVDMTRQVQLTGGE